MGLDLYSFFFVSVVNVYDFFFVQFVFEKVSFDDVINFMSQRWGFVKCVDVNERIVRVKWRDVEDLGEIVSVYELIEYFDFFFNIGDIVFRLDKNGFD